MIWNLFGRRSESKTGVGEHALPAAGAGCAGGRDALREWWEQGRHVLIVREKDRFRIHQGLNAFVDKSIEKLETNLRFVPQGTIRLAKTLNDYEGSPDEEEAVEPFLIDTFAVSNARYQKFVDAGAYDDLSLWPEEVWAYLVEFRDQSGQAGPRFWREGKYPKGMGNHPVVGVCWHEASAYGAWVGQRLVTEAEWEMAANWRIEGQRNVVQRRYPWGNSMDRQRCNIWCSGMGGTVAVDAYPSGDAPNGVRQLVGNVWEWVSSDFSVTDDSGQPLANDMPMKGIRGGAYDTYFESQATSHFRTGQTLLCRARNIGFRCGLSLRDSPWVTESEDPDAGDAAQPGEVD